MFEELPLLRMAAGLARHASARHRLIAENVANADTPGYRARDVTEFAEDVNEVFTARATRPGHLTSARASAFQPEIYIDPATQPAGNGNSVSLEAEMVRAVETQGQHAMASAIYRKAHDLLRLGLGRGR